MSQAGIKTVVNLKQCKVIVHVKEKKKESATEDNQWLRRGDDRKKKLFQEKSMTVGQREKG